MPSYLLLLDIPAILFLIYNFFFVGTESTQIGFLGSQLVGVSTSAMGRDAVSIIIGDLNMRVRQGRKGLHDRLFGQINKQLAR